MNKTDFEINLLRLHWTTDNGADEPEDQCIHGEVFIRVGNEIVSDKESGSWSIGVTALYLLRCLTEDYYPDKFGNYILPCCGHFMIPDEDDNYVTIQGCNIGKEWTIKHHKKSVEWISENGVSGSLSKSEYHNVIIKLISEIELFYNQSTPKHTPKDNFDKTAWQQYWAEWNKLKPVK